MATEAVETLNADESAELSSPAREQPQQAERMADGDGVRRPAHFSLGAACDEAEIDQGDLGPIKMADEVGPESGMKAPAMNQNKMHRVALHGARPAGRVPCG